MPDNKKKKKVDYEALHSPFMRIPKMDIGAARALIDLGFLEPHELQGMAPEGLFDKYKAIKPDATERILHGLRLAVYFAETECPDPSKLHLDAWKG